VLSAACQPAAARALIATLHPLALTAEATLIQNHLDAAKRQAATALAATARHGTYASYDKAHATAQLFQEELQGELNVRDGILLRIDKVPTRLASVRLKIRTDEILLFVFSFNSAITFTAHLQDAAQKIADRQQVATGTVEHAAHTGVHAAFVAASHAAVELGIPAYMLESARKVWQQREAGVEARAKAATQAAPFSAPEFEAAVFEVSCLLVLRRWNLAMEPSLV
jgi:hypothetical protein